MAINAVSLYRQRPGLRFWDVHVDAADQVARCAHKAGVERLVHVSGIGANPGALVVRYLFRSSILNAPGPTAARNTKPPIIEISFQNVFHSPSTQNG